MGPNPSTSTGQNNDSLNQSLKDYLFSQQPSSTRSRGNPNSQFYDPSPFNRPVVQRSASGPSTPAPSENTSQYNAHYGNKNLSPMFRAVKNDSPRPNSDLRQELPASPVESKDRNAIPNNYTTVQSKDQKFAKGGVPPHHHIFSQSAQASGSTPNLPSHFAQHIQPAFNHGQAPTFNNNHYGNGPRGGQFVPQKPPGTAPGATGGNYTGTTSGADVQTMENDLRRLLNLNAMSTGGSATTGVR